MDNISVKQVLSDYSFTVSNKKQIKEKSLREKLSEPFRKDDLSWRLQRSGKSGNGIWAMALVYVTSRAIQERLDEAVGVENWRNEFISLEKGAMCGISIKINGKWITKWDGAENTDIASFKGGISGSMKRAAVQWGIGRYLYNLKERYVECTMEKSFREKSGWKTSKTSPKHGSLTFYWQIPELETWALHPDDNVFIDLKFQKEIRGFLNMSGVNIAQFKNAFGVQEASMIKKDEYNKCLEWIEQNATNEITKPLPRMA
jgi:hypothetical protein